MSNIDFTQVVSAGDKAEAHRQTLLADLASLRWAAETGGVTLQNGFFARTDRETRAALREAVSTLHDGLMQDPIQWKTPAGWVDLTLDELEPITAAVAAHVQRCFAAELAVEAQIEGLLDLSSFDIQAAFEAAMVSA